jgi:hypothetical protein
VDLETKSADLGKKSVDLETKSADLESISVDLRTHSADVSQSTAVGPKKNQRPEGSSRSAAEKRGRAEKKRTIFQCQEVGSGSGPITAQEEPGRTCS